MTAAEHLERARELGEQMDAEISAAIEQVPAYACESLRFLKAELGVTRRRLLNAARVLGSARTTPPAA